MLQTLSIRTKLLMVALSLIASVALMAVTADDAHAQVTEIRSVENHSRWDVYLWNRESGKRLTIPAHNTEKEYNQWVPWARDQDEFNRGGFIEIGISESGNFPCAGAGQCAQLAIWQEGHSRPPYPGDYIRQTHANIYNPLGYSTLGRPVSGVPQAGGWRNLIITYSEFRGDLEVCLERFGSPRQVCAR